MARVKFNKIKTRSQALTDTSSNTNTVYFPTDNDSVIVNSKEYGEHGVINAKFFGSDLLSAINGALASITSSDSRTIIDCRGFTGSISISSTITITKPCTLLFGNVRITSSAANFFNIQSDNVAIIGAGRHTDRTVVNSKDNATVFAMTGTGATLTNDSDKGYHIYSKGNKNLRFEYFTLVGVRTTLGNQCGNASYPINGCGGIHIDKANPIETGSGNTCNNIIINQILIDGTKVHGIYISTPILTKISNVRLSQVAGHGIFLNGGTSVNLDNVYVASANLAGFCILGVTYCTLLNTVAEYVGMGYLIRGSFNVSIFSPGVEQTMNQTTNPWSSSQAISGKYGFNVQVTGTSGGSAATAIIPDVTSDFYNQFCGIPYYIQGGRNITLYTPYSTGICASNNYKGNASPAAPSRTCQLKIIGNARNVKVINLYGASISDTSGSIHNDIKIESLSGSSPNGVEIDFNTGTSLISNEWTKHVTDVSADYAPVYNDGENVLIKNAGEIYYNDYGEEVIEITYDDVNKDLVITKENGDTSTINTLAFGNAGVVDDAYVTTIETWTDSHSWYVGAFANYGHQIYKCIQNCTEGTPFSTTYFEKVADQDLTGTCLAIEFALSPSGTKCVFLDIDAIFDPDDYVKQTDLDDIPDKDALGYPTFTTTDEWDAGDIVFYNRKLYKFTTAHTGAWTGLDVESFDMKSALEDAEDKAVMTGSYDATVAVGLADNLRGDTIVDAEFYKRKTGGTQSVGSGIAAIKEVRGKSLVWNQLLKEGKLVDMGLPSGTLWASCDIDVTKADGFCETPFTYEKSFFSWGNVDGHNPISISAFDYNWGSVNQAEPLYEGQVYGETDGNTLTSNIPIGEAFDAVRKNLGAPWRMPTIVEFKELFDNSKFIDANGDEIDSSVTDKRVTINGILGIYIESLINGARLFFSCSGYGSGRSLGNGGFYGYYWSSTWYSARNARYLLFYSGGVNPQNYNSRYCGLALRPVLTHKLTPETDGNGHKFIQYGDNITDLTLMFGAGNEPASVEDFVKLYPLNRYTYNKGEVIPFAGQNLVTIGKNQYNPATSKANLLGGQTYQIGGTYTSATIDGVAVTLDSNNCFTTTNDCVLDVVGGNDTDTIVALYNGENVSYEPYEKHTIPLDPSQWRDKQGNLVFPYGGMHGVGTAYDYAKVDADGYIRKVIRVFEQVDLGSLTWEKRSGGDGVFQTRSVEYKRIENTHFVCGKYVYVGTVDGGDTAFNIADKAFCCHLKIGFSDKVLYIHDTSFENAATFKAAMDGVMLYYELAEPIEVELATPIYAKYLVDKDGTEEITPANSTTPYTTPANLSILYAMDARGEIKNLPKNYLSKESAENMLNAMVSAGVIASYTMTYDAANARYAFTIVAPQSNE